MMTMMMTATVTRGSEKEMEMDKDIEKEGEKGRERGRLVGSQLRMDQLHYHDLSSRLFVLGSSHLFMTLVFSFLSF